MKNFKFIYALILIGVLVSRIANWQIGDWIFKPLLMISLGFYFFSAVILSRQSVMKPKASRGVRQNQFVLAVLIFSLIGDVFLMFDGYFIQGLAAFLIAHLCYIYAFLPEASRFFSKKEFYLPSIAILVYAYFFLMQILPNIAEPLQKVPITVYGLTISGMLLTVLHRWNNVSKNSFWFVLVGATLFVLSDSLIAVSKFVAPFPMSGILIMATYGIGQYLIVEGFLCDAKRSQ